MLIIEPDVTIVADAVAFCRLAVRRLRPYQLDARCRRPDR